MTELPPELKEAEVSCEWIFRVMLKDARKLPSRTWLTPDDVASFLETARKGFIEIIGDMVNDLNLPENYSLKGEKKSCCQAQLMVLKHKIIAVFGGKEKKGDGEE